MTAYAIEEPAVQPAPVFTDILPAPAGEKPTVIRWTPGRRAGTGLLCVQVAARRCACEYHVAELPTDWNGRAVRMRKADGAAGSDPAAEVYDVYAGLDGDRRCDCKGFERHGRCKHAAALRALLANGWLDLHLANPDADVGDTEPPANQPEPPRYSFARAEAEAF